MQSTLKPKKVKITEPTPDEENNDEAEKYLNKLEYRIREEYPKKLHALARLREKMTDNDFIHCFDKEDLGWVDKDIKILTEELNILQKEFDEKSHLYNQTLANLQKTLNIRSEVLNEVNEETDLCKHRPELVKLFAAKQADLIKDLKECRKKVYDESKKVPTRTTKQ